MLTYHGVPLDVWQTYAAAAEFRPEGFIHTSPDRQSLADALNRHYAADDRPYLALVIELTRVTSPWRLSRQPGLGVDFPHIHGPLNRDAIVAVLPVPRSETGAFLPPSDDA